MQEYKYCPICAAPLRTASIDGRDRLTCGECGWVKYDNPLPVIACLVSNRKGDILLIKRGVDPCKGQWALPGGFIEKDETVREAGVRELEEETGLKGVPGRLVGAYMHQSPMYGAVLVVGIEFFVETEDITVGDDAEDARFLSPDDLPDIPFASHLKLITQFLSG